MGNVHIEAVRQYASTLGKVTVPEEAKAFITISVRDTKQGVSGPAPEWRGVSRSLGSPGTAPQPVWGPTGDKRVMENDGSECNFDEQLATGLLYFFSLACSPTSLPLGAPSISYP